MESIVVELVWHWVHSSWGSVNGCVISWLLVVTTPVTASFDEVITLEAVLLLPKMALTEADDDPTVCDVLCEIRL